MPDSAAITCFRALVAVLIGLWLQPAMAARHYIPRVPESMEDVSFYLTTAGVGREVNDRFGHTGIRVVNREEGSDVVFNWGQFSFEDPTFLWKFFRGQLDYSMGVHALDKDVASYREMKRLLRMERLNLSPKQKRFLYEKIAWNAVPEHRTFSYQYWYKNCSTIPRDYLNEALTGRLFQRFGQLPAGKVYRDYVRGNLAYTPFVVPQLDVMMNSNIDRPISAWEDMFLPSQLRQWLLTMPALDDDGKELSGQMLLSESEILNDTLEVYTPPFNDYVVELAPLLLSLAVGGLAFCLFAFGGSAAWLVRGYQSLGLAALYWGLLGGCLGLTLLINWGFSGHPDGWHNTNLLLFWPLDLLFIPLGWQLARSGGPLPPERVEAKLLRRFCWLHALSLALLCGLTKAGVLQQNIWHAAAWFGLPLLLFLLLFGRFAPALPSRWRSPQGHAA